MIPQIPERELVRQQVLIKIWEDLRQAGMTVEQAVILKGLYFRVSLVGFCNNNCEFCHNEGAPRRHQIDTAFAIKAIELAAKLGFTRVQFTGGEPLLHPDVVTCVEKAKQIVPQVGITTNGTLLNNHIRNLMKVGLTQLHISLGSETLKGTSQRQTWGIPDFLFLALDQTSRHGCDLRINLPVPMDELDQARSFLEVIGLYECDVQVLSILSNSGVGETSEQIDSLREMVELENYRRESAGQSGIVFLRDFRIPAGIRCPTCAARKRCKEYSRSLRLGADHILRPCLATREWDSWLDLECDAEQQMVDATLLSVDY
jgi:molybdenum cofactor biosynthesis enzyme MoaA